MSIIVPQVKLSDIPKEQILSERWHALLFDIRTFVRYHQRRVAFFSRWHSITQFFVTIILVANTITLASGLDYEVALAVLSGIAVIITLAGLMMDTFKMVREHETLYRKFIDLEIKWTGIHDPTEQDWLNLLQSKRHLELEGPPPSTVLMELCWNETARSTGIKDRVEVISWWQRILASFSSCSSMHRVCAGESTSHQDAKGVGDKARQEHEPPPPPPPLRYVREGVGFGVMPRSL